MRLKKFSVNNSLSISWSVSMSDAKDVIFQTCLSAIHGSKKMFALKIISLYFGSSTLSH